MPEVHWIAVPLVTMLVLVLLLWGLRSVPAAQCNPEDEANTKDDMPAPRTIAFSPSLEPLSVSHLASRRFLTGIWNADTPDLTVACWMNPDYPAIRFTSFLQTFLPMEGSMADAMAVMEGRIFDCALEQDVPERSRLLTAWTFMHLPVRRQDLVVQSYFAGTRLDHTFFLMDADGKLSRIHIEPETGGELLMGAAWVPYRNCVCAVQEDGSPAEEFEALLAGAATAPKAHAWLAHLANHSGAPQSDVLRHTALSLEFDPGNYMARIEKSRFGDGSALRDVVAGLKSYLASQTDDEAQAGYLLAQSLVALGQAPAARILCEMLLSEETASEATSRLLHLIKQRERGAQT